MASFYKALLFGFVLALVGWACGSGGGAAATTGPEVSALAPANDEVSNWIGDTTNVKTGGVAKVATNYTDAVALVDGSADPFWKQSTGIAAKAFAYNTYVNTANPAITIDHRVWQLASAADCLTVYADLLTYQQYVQPWTDVQLGDKARVAIQVAVRVNVCKGAYLIETSLFGDPSAAGQAELLKFVNAMLAKIP
jgi:hypothetical protein